MAAFPQRGEVYIVDFGEPKGSEQGGARPAVVVSNNVQNERSPVLIVAAVTHTIPKKSYPHTAAIPPGTLDAQGGTVYCHQLRTVSKDRLGNFKGTLPPEVMAGVDSGLSVAIGLS